NSESEDETSESEDENETVLLDSNNQIKNISRTCHCKPRRYPSWKKYWVGISERDWPTYCRIMGCSEPAVGGGHVYIRHMEEDVYIIPMCHSHNSPHNFDWYDVKEPTTAVMVDEDDTKGEGTCYRTH
ncbi:hypothetical protein, partial [Salmonella sp. s54925]|uniref:hypothetical protein n=1 Tax=Salmonella sp. s54925 TaxID=3159674 RepID=UPI003980AA74